MAKSEKRKSILSISASVWLKDDQRFVIVRRLDLTPRPGEILEIDGERWRVVEWTDQIECEWVVN